jgi:hypothetical protein
MIILDYDDTLVAELIILYSPTRELLWNVAINEIII